MRFSWPGNHTRRRNSDTRPFRQRLLLAILERLPLRNSLRNVSTGGLSDSLVGEKHGNGMSVASHSVNNDETFRRDGADYIHHIGHHTGIGRLIQCGGRLVHRIERQPVRRHIFISFRYEFPMLQKHTLRLGACPERGWLRLSSRNRVTWSTMEIDHYMDPVLLSKGDRPIQKRKLRRIYRLPIVRILQPSAVVQR